MIAEREPGDGRRETVLERADRNLVELLQELRVAQTGVQVLFAFLLTLPFTARFASVSPLQKAAYFTTLLTTGCAAVLLIAPTSWHRIVFRRGDKEHLVEVANRFALAGLACVALSMTGAVLLVSDVLFGAAATGAGCAVLWCALPLRRRRELLRRADGRPAAERNAAAVGARRR